MILQMDPAKELMELVSDFKVDTRIDGVRYLTDYFHLDASPTDFAQMIAAIHERFDLVSLLNANSGVPDQLKPVIEDRLSTMRQAFAPISLAGPWADQVDDKFRAEILLPVQMLSGYIAAEHGYNRPNPEELEQLDHDVKGLIEWLSAIQEEERDFIREALIEGLTRFRFRVRNFRWYGWPATFGSLREVAAAYMALERGKLPEAEPGQYEAMMMKTAGLLKSIFEKFKFAKDVQDVTDWVLKGYGAVHLAGGATTTIAGLLTHLSK